MDASFIPFSTANKGNFIKIVGSDHSVFTPDIISKVNAADEWQKSPLSKEPGIVQDNTYIPDSYDNGTPPSESMVLKRYLEWRELRQIS